MVQRVVGRNECEDCFQVGLMIGTAKAKRPDLVRAGVEVGEHVMRLGGGTLVVNTFGREVGEGVGEDEGEADTDSTILISR